MTMSWPMSQHFSTSASQHALQAGLGEELMIVDPGFGFGKTHAHNVELLANLRQLQRFGLPVLVGVSRKSTLGDITGGMSTSACRPVSRRRSWRSCRARILCARTMLRKRSTH